MHVGWGSALLPSSRTLSPGAHLCQGPCARPHDPALDAPPELRESGREGRVVVRGRQEPHFPPGDSEAPSGRPGGGVPRMPAGWVQRRPGRASASRRTERLAWEGGPPALPFGDPRGGARQGGRGPPSRLSLAERRAGTRGCGLLL